ncbi:hypothetical protein DSO57_1001583 [Entomophthora muscae]|uniref:Uncharacterized protein n=1 Tax=Entomophthora muscae TaxID=34485 RepID=A0ACC2SAT1_9FUNG|nr:hypothetical protein DSO57_1001583 [Entomophthora muscae]
MTLLLTLQPNCPMETPAAAETTFTQMFVVLYITLMGMIDTMVPNSGPWSLLGQSVSYIIMLAPILWWALPSGPAVFQPKPTNASTYAWLPDTMAAKKKWGNGTELNEASDEELLSGSFKYGIDKEERHI